MPQKLRQKCKYLENKRAFKMKEKAFFIIFKGVPLKQIKKFFLEGESPKNNICDISSATLIPNFNLF